MREYKLSLYDSVRGNELYNVNYITGERQRRRKNYELRGLSCLGDYGHNSKYQKRHVFE